MRTLIVVPCGSAKQSTPAPADAFYTGGYHRACMAYAHAIAAGARVVILSAKYGFVELSQTLEPYNVTFGDLAAVTVEELAYQLEQLGRFDAVKVLGGKRYVAMVRAVAPGAVQIIPDVGGIGYQLQWLKRNRPPAVVV